VGLNRAIEQSGEGRGLGGRGQNHDINRLVPAADSYPMGTAPWVPGLNQRVARSGKHDLAGGRVGLRASTDVDGIAKGGEGQDRARTHIADESDTSVGGDTEGQFGHR
jgi:hypothetical protein